MSRADYGIDAPPVVRNLAIGGLALLAVGTTGFMFLPKPWFSSIIGYWGVLAGISMLLTSAFMVRSSKAGKLQKRNV